MLEINTFLVIFWPLSLFLKWLKTTTEKSALERFAINISGHTCLFCIVVYEEKPFFCPLNFLMQYLEWPLGINQRVTVLPVQYPVLIIHPWFLHSVSRSLLKALLLFEVSVGGHAAPWRCGGVRRYSSVILFHTQRQEEVLLLNAERRCRRTFRRSGPSPLGTSPPTPYTLVSHVSSLAVAVTH